MTNKELIETAQQAMKDLSATNMLEHEQTAYNCLRLFCERLSENDKLNADIQAGAELIARWAKHNEALRAENDRLSKAFRGVFYIAQGPPSAKKMREIRDFVESTLEHQ